MENIYNYSSSKKRVTIPFKKQPNLFRKFLKDNILENKQNNKFVSNFPKLKNLSISLKLKKNLFSNKNQINYSMNKTSRTNKTNIIQPNNIFNNNQKNISNELSNITPKVNQRYKIKNNNIICIKNHLIFHRNQPFSGPLTKNEKISSNSPIKLLSYSINNSKIISFDIAKINRKRNKDTNKKTIDNIFKFSKSNYYSKFKKKVKRNEKEKYLNFLDEQSLELRANYIKNNILYNRGGKQTLRLLYNPKDC